MKNKKITQQQQQNTDTSTEIVSYLWDNSSFYDDYSYVNLWLLLLLLLLLLKFMCSCTSTRTITGQQQHEMVTTTHSDLHKLFSVQELIFPIQQQNINTSSEKLMLICTHHLIIGGYIWALHQQVDLLGYFIWKLYPILPSVHVILFSGVYLTAYLGTSSDKLT